MIVFLNFAILSLLKKRIEKYLMVSVNARKWGLIVSLTRFIHFGHLSQELRQKYEANVFIDCTFMAHTRPGVPAREVLQKGIEAYRQKGYPTEWELHHQGGSIGYTGRDYRVNFQTPDLVQINQAFTWNPSITGTKSEDTIQMSGCGKTCGKPVENLWKTPVENFSAEFSTGNFHRQGALFHRFSTKV